MACYRILRVAGLSRNLLDGLFSPASTNALSWLIGPFRSLLSTVQQWGQILVKTFSRNGLILSEIQQVTA